jgi:hypothetical protein
MMVECRSAGPGRMLGVGRAWGRSRSCDFGRKQFWVGIAIDLVFQLPPDFHEFKRGATDTDHRSARSAGYQTGEGDIANGFLIEEA